MNEQTIDLETGEIHGGDEPDDARAEAAREAEQEADLAAAPKRETTQAQLQKADAANRAYMRKLDSILGEDENRHECSACNGLGVTWGEQAAEPALAAAEDAEACPKCNAYGLTTTGSLQPGQETKPCVGCGGRGWREKAVPVTFVPQVVPSEPPVAQVLQGQYVPGRGFIPYGSDEPLPGTLGA